jgi:hypothetical protein
MRASCRARMGAITEESVEVLWQTKTEVSIDPRIRATRARVELMLSRRRRRVGRGN